MWMGGFGSTRWAGTGTKGSVEANLPLDLNRLNRAGCLRPGFRGAWEWTLDGKPFASIQVSSEADRLVLSYVCREHSGEWRNVEQPTQVVWAQCRFGGRRPHFLCPNSGCGRRVSKLYGADVYFLCRCCHDLAYPSQRESSLDGMFRRADKIRTRLGEKSERWTIPGRPRGMHRSTYDRLLSALLEADMVANEAFDKRVEQLEQMEERRRARPRR
jgi:hypothetical protein